MTPPPSKPLPFPTDYSICPVCNLDHRHDLLNLSPGQKADVLQAHVDSGEPLTREFLVELGVEA
jgi:hypothetical protein